MEMVLLVAVLIVALARIVDTYRSTGQTFDEAAHLAAGIEYLDTGRFTYNRMHPPLPRLLIAALPYLKGAHYTGEPDLWNEGASVMRNGAGARQTLTLARLGVLPFFVLATLATWWLTRRVFGAPAGLLAATAFTLLPPVLAHAGLATTDMAITAAIPLVVLAALPWLEAPTRRASIWLGVAIGFAVNCKFSAIFFIPASLFLMLAAKVLVEPGTSEEKLARLRRLERPLLLVLVVTCLTVWAGYGFSIGSLRDTVLGPHLPPSLARIPLLAPEFWDGLFTLAGYDTVVYDNTVLGRTIEGGTWYYFPLAIAVKTPLAFLFLAGAGLAYTARRAWASRTWTYAIALAVSAALLAVVMRSNLNLGLRHVLPIYPFLSMAAASAAVACWRAGQPTSLARAAAVGLAGWFLLASARAHPYYLPSFNEIAENHPERFLLTGDLDWGQDIDQLNDTLRARGIDSVSLGLFGLTDRRQIDPGIAIARFRPDSATGWVAVSAWWLYGYGLGPEAKRFQFVTRIGRTIWLYHVPPKQPGRATEQTAAQRPGAGAAPRSRVQR